MERLNMCRICLVEDVRMYIVAHRNLYKLYEKLTDVPFVTEDRRPLLVCFFCFAKLKQCYKLMRNCLIANELFAQILDVDYVPNPLIDTNLLVIFGGFEKVITHNISTVNVRQIETIVIKDELPAVYEGLDDNIEPKETHQSDELELENLNNSCHDVADIPPHHSESDLEDITHNISTVNVGQIQSIAIKEELPAVYEGLDDNIEPEETHQSDELELENLNNSCHDVADIPPHHSVSDSEDDVPLMEFEKKKRRASEMTRATVTKEPELVTRRTIPEDAIPAEPTKKDKSDSKVIRTTQKRTAKTCTYFKESYKGDQRSFNQIKQMIQKTGEKLYKCNICQRSFRQKGHLKNHIRIHTGEKPYKCDICQLSFRKKGILTTHILVHTKKKPSKCDIYQRSFRQKGHLTNHIRIHTGEKPYKCDICQLSFRKKGILTTHILVHTKKKPYKCDICQRSFSLKGSLTNHNRIHTVEKPYKCDVCQRSFSLKGSLTNHIRIHTGEKPYKCDICQLSFRKKGILTTHILVHTKKKPYKCDICQRSFSLKGSLTNHIRIHTGEKPYKCDICQLSFRKKGILTTHILVHTKKKPYKCDICQRSFSQKGSLTNHNRIHTVEKPYKCDVCQRSFSENGSLTKHSRRHCRKTFQM